MIQKIQISKSQNLGGTWTSPSGYGIPIELFGPFADCCVEVMHPMIMEFENPVAPWKKHRHSEGGWSRLVMLVVSHEGFNQQTTDGYL